MIYNINKIETILASFYLTLYNLRLVYYIVPTVIDYMYSANESSTYMTSVGKGGAGAQQKVSHQHIFFLSRALVST